MLQRLHEANENNVFHFPFVCCSTNMEKQIKWQRFAAMCFFLQYGLSKNQSQMM
jgi:hypothetical protein